MPACIVTGRRPVEAAHISYADPAYGKRERGKSEKADDRWTVPLCREKHAKQHRMGDERAYWNSVGIDPLKVAAALYGISGDTDMGLVIIIIRQWRGKYADKPRTADYGMQVLSRVLSYAVDPLAKISSNPCEGIKQIYSNDRAAIIWTDEDIAQLKGARSKTGKLTCAEELGFAVDLAAHTGLRVSDLVRLSWSHVQSDMIVITTGKSNHKREAIIPLYDDLSDLLKRIPKRSTCILTSSRQKPWTSDGLASSFHTAKQDAGMGDRNLHFHDLRGTAATKFYTAGIPERAIAEIMGWDEDDVAKIIRRYVDRTAATKAIIKQIAEAKRRT